MNKIKELFKDLFKHKIFLVTFIITIVLNILNLLVFAYYISKIDIVRTLYTLVAMPIIFLPSLFVLIIFAICNIFINKHPIFVNIFGTIINIITMAISYFILPIILLYSLLYIAWKPYTSPRDYNRALNSISKKEIIKNFPNKIPEDAKNVRFYKSGDVEMGNDPVILAFDIDSQYITNELNKYKCHKLTEESNKKTNIYINQTLKTNDSYIFSSCRIGHNKEKTRIIYY